MAAAETTMDEEMGSYTQDTRRLVSAVCREHKYVRCPDPDVFTLHQPLTL